MTFRRPRVMPRPEPEPVIVAAAALTAGDRIFHPHGGKKVFTIDRIGHGHQGRHAVIHVYCADAPIGRYTLLPSQPVRLAP